MAQTTNLHAEHAAVVERMSSAHEATLADLERRRRESEASAREERERLLAAHAATVSDMEARHAVTVARLEQSVREDAASIEELAPALDVALLLQRRLDEAEANVRTLFKLVLRMNRLVAINVEAARAARAASVVQRFARQRIQRRARAARILQAGWLEGRANRAEQEAIVAARQEREATARAKRLEASIETQRFLTQQATRAAAVSTQLNSAKMREQESKLSMIEEQQRQAKEEATRLMVKGKDGKLVALREGIFSVFDSELVQAQMDKFITSTSSAGAAPLAGGKFAADDVQTLLMGDPQAAALGLWKELKVDMFELFGLLAKGVDAIVMEVEASGNATDRECLNYVLNQRAGSSPKIFPNSPHPRDCTPSPTPSIDQ